MAERCDWVHCRNEASWRSLRHRPDPKAFPRPAHTANELFFCDEHVTDSSVAKRNNTPLTPREASQ